MAALTRLRSLSARSRYLLVGIIMGISPLFLFYKSVLAESFGNIYRMDAFGNISYDAEVNYYTPFTLAGFEDNMTNMVGAHGGLFASNQEGELYGVGDNTCRILDETSGFVSDPIKITSVSGVKTMAYVNTYLYVLYSDGTLERKDCLNPQQSLEQVNLGSPVEKLAGNGSHGLILTEVGDVYAWGENTLGQVGIGLEAGSIIADPQLINAFDRNVQDIAIGNSYSAALLDDGRVFSWGKYNNVEGLGYVFNLNPEPVRVGEIESVSLIAAGSSVLYMQKTDGSVWAVGADSRGSMGATPSSVPRADGRYYTSVPVEVVALNGAERIWAGADYVIGEISNTLLALGGQERCNYDCSSLEMIYAPYELGLDSSFVEDLIIGSGDFVYIVSNRLLIDIVVDRTPPELGQASWTNNPKPVNGDTTLFIPASDDLSGVAGGEIFFCGEDPGVGNGGPLEYNGTGLTFYVPEGGNDGDIYELCFRAFDNGGNVSEVGSATLYIGVAPDTVSPTVLGTPDRSPNAYGWYSAPVTITWQSVDPAPSSGAPNVPSPTVASQQGLHNYTSGQSCDGIGNCSYGELSLSIDSVNPTGSLSSNQLVVRLLGLTVSGSTTDVTSGVESIKVVAGNKTWTSTAGGGLSLNCNSSRTSCSWSIPAASLPLGIYSYTLTVTDYAGNTYNTSKVYTVL